LSQERCKSCGALNPNVSSDAPPQDIGPLKPINFLKALQRKRTIAIVLLLIGGALGVAGAMGVVLAMEAGEENPAAILLALVGFVAVVFGVTYLRSKIVISKTMKRLGVGTAYFSQFEQERSQQFAVVDGYIFTQSWLAHARSGILFPLREIAQASSLIERSTNGSHMHTHYVHLHFANGRGITLGSSHQATMDTLVTEIEQRRKHVNK